MYEVNPALNFKIINKDGSLHIAVTGPLPDENTLKAEFARLNIQISPDILTQIIHLDPHNELDLDARQMEKEETGPQDPIRIAVPGGKMYAYLAVRSNGDISYTVQDLEKELRKAGVVFGIRKEALAEALQNPGRLLPVAFGCAPLDGQDSINIMYFQEPEKKPVFTEDGRVNYYELGQVVCIHAGDIIGVRTPATPGENGSNVLGETLPAKPGRDYHLPVDKGIMVIDNKAVAEYDGALSWDQNKVSVIKSITINGDVDFSVGNIDFPGKVLITGHVMEGFKVQADDDIEVSGGVDDATVISRNGSVFVHKGIIGRGKGMVIARKNVEAKFIQECVVEAGQDIIVNEYVIRCDMKAGNSVLLQGYKGRIMGNNNIVAKTRIKAAKIQNASGLHLVVEGIDRARYYERVKEMNDKIRDLEKKLSSLAAQIRRLKDRTVDPESLINLKKLLPEYFDINTELVRCTEERDLIAAILKNTRGEGMIELGSGLERGMRLTIKDESINIKESQGKYNMFFDPDEKRIKQY